MRPLLPNLSPQFPPTLVLLPPAGTRVCPNSPASLLPPPPDPFLEEVLTCPPPREALGQRSRLCAASPAPPRLPASRDAGVLPCSGQQPLPERHRLSNRESRLSTEPIGRCTRAVALDWLEVPSGLGGLLHVFPLHDGRCSSRSLMRGPQGVLGKLRIRLGGEFLPGAGKGHS